MATGCSTLGPRQLYIDVTPYVDLMSWCPRELIVKVNGCNMFYHVGQNCVSQNYNKKHVKKKQVGSKHKKVAELG